LLQPQSLLSCILHAETHSVTGPSIDHEEAKLQRRQTCRLAQFNVSTHASVVPGTRTQSSYQLLLYQCYVGGYRRRFTSHCMIESTPGTIGPRR